VLTRFLFLRFGQKPLARLQEAVGARQELGKYLAPASPLKKEAGCGQQAGLRLLGCRSHRRQRPAVRDGSAPTLENSARAKTSRMIGEGDVERPGIAPGRTADWASVRDAPRAGMYSTGMAS